MKYFFSLGLCLYVATAFSMSTEIFDEKKGSDNNSVSGAPEPARSATESQKNSQNPPPCPVRRK